MKVLSCVLVACLAVSAVFGQTGPNSAAASSAAGQPNPALLAAALASSTGGSPMSGGINQMLGFGALTGTMGDSIREYYLCKMMRVPEIICMRNMLF